VTVSSTPDVPAGDAAELLHRIQGLEAERDELARACREAREAREAAEEATRVRDEILGVVAHDLRNPLGTIVMGATALEQFGGGAAPNAQRIRTVAERIQRQANRMVRQLGNLTDFVEIQAGRLTIDRATQTPATLLAAASEVIGPIARERSVGLEVHAAADLPTLSCDTERVIQALFNLCVSAIKVTAGGGVVEIGARRGERGPLELFVRDHGPGIESDELSTMFEPSWRSKQSAYKGAGLGYAVARGVAVAHGGRIWAESAAGVGTTVVFSLAPEH
jgi:signal transduction histidine kinase